MSRLPRPERTRDASPSAARTASRILMWGGLVLALSTALAVDPGGFNPFGPAKALVVSIAALAMASGIVLEPPPRIRFSRPVGVALASALGLYLGVTALSAVTSVDVVRSLVGSYPEYQGLAAMLLYVVTGAVTLQLVVTDERAPRYLARAICVILAFVSVYGVLQHFGMDPVIGAVNAPADELSSARSTLGNASNLGVYLVIALPFAAWLVRRDASRVWRAVAAAGFVSGLFALAWTNSRGSWLALGAAIVVWLAFEARDMDPGRRRGFVAVAAASLVAAAAAVALVPGLGGRALWSSVTTGSGAWRLNVWAASARMVGQRPFLGWGPNSFRFVYPLFRPAGVVDSLTIGRVVADPHDALISAAAASGVVAALALAAAFAAGFVALWTRSRDDARPGAAVAPAVAAALTAVAVATAFHFVTLDTGPYLGVLFGIALAVCSSRPTEQSSSDAGWRVGARVVAGIAAGLALVLAIGAAGLVVADRAQRQAFELAGSGAPWAVVEPAVATAQRLAPWEPVFRSAEGRVAATVMLSTRDPEAYRAGAKALADGGAMAPLDAGFLADRAVLDLTATDALGDESYARRSAGEFKAALRTDPNNVAYWIGYGSALARYGALSDAIDALKRAIELAPRDRFLYKAIARVYDAAKMPAEAKAARDRATELLAK